MFKTMFGIRRWWVVVGVFLVLSGCVKRKESITIHDDGSVALAIEVEGDRADVENGLPMLVKTEGWQFTHKLETDKDGKETLTLGTSATIPAGQPLPDVYPTNDKDSPSLAVRHPTSLTVERRSDGTYYHFRRVYPTRDWAMVNYWRHDLIEEPLERSDAESVEEMSAEKKQELVENLIKFESIKQLTLARVAAESMHPPMPQDVWLSACEAVRNAAEAIDEKALLERLERENADQPKPAAVAPDATGASAENAEPKSGAKDDDHDDPTADELTRMGRQYQEKIGEALRRALQSKRIAPQSLDAFQKAYDTEMRRFAMTEDLGDEEWEVAVTMPGTLVGHNADKVDGNTVTFEFGGQAIYDRDVELLVTSVVR